MKKIIFFSNNINKLIEIRSLFKNLNLKILSPKDFNIKNEPKEVGSSFAENARIKSKYGFDKTNLPCFADDSGICIEALDWKPGIFSKRFKDKFATDKECFNFIIEKVKNSKKNKAYFQTSVCLTLKNNYHVVFEGKVHGTISKKILGKNGFGYDPIFKANENAKTFAELNKAEKNKLSHRSIAINKLVSFLVN